MTFKNQFNLDPTQKVSLFIDGANLSAASKSLGIDLDFKRIRAYFSANSKLVRAFYYTALLGLDDHNPLKPLVDFLDYNGYQLVTKSAKVYEVDGERRIKGNLDIEMTVDMLECANHLDHLVLFTGDGDFRRAVEAVQRRGKHVTVVSTIRSRPAIMADELRRQADHFVDLEDLRDVFGRQGELRTILPRERLRATG